jgi:hypothetical protein
MGQGERDNQMLMRIATILLLLADVAMRASSAPDPVRWRLFVILSQGEAIARLYALGFGVSALSANGIRAHDSVEPADLMNLALRFCMLALVLRIAAARSRPEGASPDHGWPASLTDGTPVVVTKAAEAHADGAQAYPDTS